VRPLGERPERTPRTIAFVFSVAARRRAHRRHCDRHDPASREPRRAFGIAHEDASVPIEAGRVLCHVCDRVLAVDLAAARGAKRSPRRDHRNRRGAATSILLTMADAVRTTRACRARQKAQSSEVP
jgi:hypothetical protein